MGLGSIVVGMGSLGASGGFGRAFGGFVFGGTLFVFFELGGFVVRFLVFGIWPVRFGEPGAQSGTKSIGISESAVAGATADIPEVATGWYIAGLVTIEV